MKAETIFSQIRYEESRDDAPPGFPSLPEVPGGRYTDPAFFALEVERVFRPAWHLAGHVADLPEPRSYFIFDKLLGKPILVVRDREGEVRAFYNTCRHRGAPIVKDAAGRCNLLRCQYHSWAYDFDGRLLSVPDAHDFPGLDKADRGLIQLRCETFEGLIFVNEDPKAIPLVEWLGPLAEEWRTADLRALVPDYRWSRVIGCNWKCALDAFQEVYHIKTLHPTTVGAALDHHATAISLLPNGHSRMCVRYAHGDCETRPDGGWSDRSVYEQTSVAHTMWPALNVPWRIGSGKFMMFWPRGVDQCEVQIIGVGMPWGEGPLPAARQAGNDQFDSILMEDVENLEAIQASLESGAFTGMILGYQERRLYWSHEQIDRAIGIDRLEKDLRVEQLLSPLVESPA
ncbi:aromatic ring-hydroxylating dioxygenase subunit alpha [Novosphingobium tardum]|uniref:Aromatic ring-hydroxylating dioxygenase subunit alpha n=1 Tax=Novosphingobium tardum TaxID=1538021 RepID=A0ABV8RR57_9SPHN